MNTIELVRGDITTVDVDMIVNAANAALCGGGGVDGAIHRSAGPELLALCRTLGGARAGDVRVTHGFHLPARFIAHAVSPVWQGGDCGEPALLASCYAMSIQEAGARSLSSIAFPSISTGAYRYPIEKAARIAIDTIQTSWSAWPSLHRVTIVCFDDHDLRAYRRALAS